jgi:hypothetical protein
MSSKHRRHHRQHQQLERAFAEVVQIPLELGEIISAIEAGQGVFLRSLELEALSQRRSTVKRRKKWLE